MYNPLDKVNTAPAKVITVGNSCQIRKPHMMLIGRDKYSKGAITDACATLYARDMKYIQPAQINPSPAMMIPSRRVGRVHSRIRNSMLG